MLYRFENKAMKLCPHGANSLCGEICPDDTKEIKYICPQQIEFIPMQDVQKIVEEPYNRLGFRDRWEMKYLRLAIDDHSFVGIQQAINEIDKLSVNMTIAEIGLFCEEIGELLEAIRKDYPLTLPNKTKDETSIGEECADLFIRLVNLCNRLGINLTYEVLKKHSYNVDRAYLHGKKA